jgi:glycosyl transferase family 2
VTAYVLPMRCEACAPGDHDELADYLATIANVADVIVADGSPPAVRARHAVAFGGVATQVSVEARSINGKVDGVCAGVRAATSERIIVADDDVRYTPVSVRAVADALDDADVVVPQNVFPPDMPWHARWDSSRSLINRALGTDYPGTLALRRSTFVAAGGYDGDVLFENLELIRTVEAAAGRVRIRRDLFVTRLPPGTDRFLEQRVRQAYDDFARPARLIAALATLPLVAAAARGRRWGLLAAGTLASIAVAEVGRRRDDGVAHFPASTPLFAPVWLVERGACAWLAVASRLVLGGCVYRGRVIRQAATPRRELRRRQRAQRRGTRRTAASSVIARSGTAAPRLAAG